MYQEQNTRRRNTDDENFIKKVKKFQSIFAAIFVKNVMMFCNMQCNIYIFSVLKY